MRKIRGAISYSNVVATAALFLALSGGAAYAASTMGKGSVTSANLAPNAVTSRSIAKDAVKSKNLAAKAVQSRNIAKNAVKSKSLAANAVQSKNIGKNAVTSKSLAANAVTGEKIKKEAITASNVKQATLTRSNLATGTLAGLQVAEVTAAGIPGLTTATETGTSVPLSGSASFTPQAGKSYELLAEMKGTPTVQPGPEGEEFCFAEVAMLVNGVALGGVTISASPGQPAPFNVRPVGTFATALGLQESGQALTLTASSFGSPGCSTATTGTLRAVVVELG
jgi:hypothetical protein